MLGPLILLLVLGIWTSSSFAASTEYYVDGTVTNGDTAASGEDWAITLGASASITTGAYVGYGIYTYDGTGADQYKEITIYEDTKRAEVDSAWGTQPDNTTVYRVCPGSNSNAGTAAGLGNAWLTLQYACDNVGVPAGNEYSRINVLSGNDYIINSSIDVDTVAAGGNNPIVVQGYTSSIEDGGQATIDCNDGAPDAVAGFAVTKGHWVFRDLVIEDPTDRNFGCQGSQLRITNVDMYTAGDNCTEGSGTNQLIMGCEVYGIDDNSLDCNGAGWNIFYNYVHDGGSGNFAGIRTTSSSMRAFMNIVDTYDGYGVQCNQSTCMIVGNTVYNMVTDSVWLAVGNADNTVLVNNILDSPGDDNVQVDNGSALFIDYHNVYRNAGGDDRVGAIFMHEGRSTADPDFVDAAGGDFNIGSSNAIDDIGYPTSIQSNTWHLEPGALMYEETGGGTSAYSFVE